MQHKNKNNIYTTLSFTYFHRLERYEGKFIPLGRITFCHKHEIDINKTKKFSENIQSFFKMRKDIWINHKKKHQNYQIRKVI